MTREVIIAISDNWHDREYRRWVSIWYDPGLSYTPCHIDNIQPQVLFKKWAEIYYQVRFKNLTRSREFSNQIIHDWEFFEQFQKFYRSPHSCTITKYLITDLVWVISVSNWYQETMTGSYYNLWLFLTKLCWHIKHTSSSPCGGFHSPRCTMPYCPSPSSLRSLRSSDGIRQASLSVRP